MAVSGRPKLAGLQAPVRDAAEWCLAQADGYGIPVTVVSGFRSTTEQRRLWNNYQQCLRTGRFGLAPDCKYPANRPGFSAHEYGLAWDSTVPPEYMGWWVALRRYAGFHVIEGDLPHAEYPRWRDFVRLPSGSDG